MERVERLFLAAILILLYPEIAPGQSDRVIQKQIDDMMVRLKMLENDNQLLQMSARENDSLLYCSVRLEIFDAFTKVQQLEFDFENTTDKIAVSGLFAKLIEANNPSSDILGFRFTDLVFKAAEKHFCSQLRDEKDKNRFKEIILKIINNPLVLSLSNSNPLTSVVSGIINAVIGFTTSEVNIEKEGGKIKDVDVTQRGSFNSEHIAGFRDDLQAYITFYDQLIAATEKYLSGLEFLEGKYAFLMSSLIAYRNELFGYLEPIGGNQILSLIMLLPEPERDKLDFGFYLKNPDILNCLATARKFPFLEQSVSDYKKELNHLLFDFLSSYIVILKSTEGFPDAALEKSRAESLILEIEHFIEDQQLVGDNTLKASYH